MTEPELLRQLERLETARIAVQNLDHALSALTPEERLVANLLFLYPRRGNIQEVCRLLHVEQATAYRRRKQVLQKIAAALTCADRDAAM